MKKYLLPEKGKFYKANLHCHTTVSDGNRSPEKVKEIYQSQGYSIVAFTDHDVLISQSHLKDESFLPLNGLEVEIPSPILPDSPKKRPWVHLCLIAKDENNLTMPFYHRSLYIKYNEAENRAKLIYREDEPDYVREWDVERINELIALAKERGFFVTYNHPAWSFEDATRLTQYRGLDAIEIFNSGSFVQGYEDNTPIHYSTMARHGIRLFPVAADDNHNKNPFDHPANDACLGWVQIKAEKLEYSSVMRALEAGEFYASTGPEIYDVWTEDGRIHVRTSSAKMIAINCVGGRCSARHREDAPLTEASFELVKERGGVRVAVYDDNGGYATTRFYYPEEW
ncbi:MAG: PHP domain-containing protein [Clostridia bacterium]|nr:PHP domain-containing protein [Clostridia bacterium]